MNDNPAVRMHDLMVPYLNLRTKPQDISSELAYEVAAIVIEWGAFENAVAIDVEQLRNWPIVRKLADEVPRNFDGKLKLWKRSIDTLFAKVPLYRNQAREIASKGKLVARQRHRLIHGMWRPDKNRPGEFQVLSGFDPRQQFGYLQVNLELAKAIHHDVRTMSEAVWSFLVTRMAHAAEGRLVAHALPPAKSKSGTTPLKRKQSHRKKKKNLSSQT